jgi:tetratricopeptide (TPR) repeat protein
LQPVNIPVISGIPARLALAGTSISFYFAKFFCPVDMMPIYPRWPVDPAKLISFLPWLVLAGAFYWLWSKRARWGRHVLLGLGFFAINLLPFIGFTSVSFMGFAWVMDHFLYIPMIGLIGLTIAALENIEGRISRPMRYGLAGMTAAALALLALESEVYAGMFVGPEKLWTYTVERNPTAWLAYNNLGNAYFETGRVPEAIEAYEKALQLNPSMTEANNNLGLALYHQGRIPEAIEHYEQALKYNPHFALAHSNLANALSGTGRVPEAIDHYEQALLVNPHDQDALANLARLKAAQKTSSR